MPFLLFLTFLPFPAHASRRAALCANDVAQCPNSGQYQMQSWWVADDIAPSFIGVAEWRDHRFLSGGLTVLTQGGGGLRPSIYGRAGGLTAVSAPNGHQYLHFTGAGSGLSATGQYLTNKLDDLEEDYLFSSGDPNYTFAIVFRRTETMSGVGINPLPHYLINIPPTASRGLWIESTFSDLAISNVITLNNLGGVFGDPFLTYPHYDTSWHYIIAWLDGGFYSLYFDGVLISTAEHDLWSRPTEFKVGGTGANGSFFWGDIAEVIVWRTNPTIQSIRDYINGKYHL